MLSSLKQVLSEYHVFIIKMYTNMQSKPTVKGAEANFSRLVDVKTVLSLAAILPLL
jgi:hypothetical protein